MLSSITLDDADGNPVTLHEETGRRQASSVSGLIGIGAPRDSRRVRPNAHGGIDETRFEDGRLIVIEGEVDDPGDVNGAIAEFRAVEAAMLETWDVGPALLKWQEGPNAPRTNEVPNPSGENDLTGWGGQSAGTTLASVADATVGGPTNAVEFAASAYASTTAIAVVGSSGAGSGTSAIPVAEGEVIALGCRWSVVSVSGGTITSLQPQVNFYDAAGASVSTSANTSQANPVTGTTYDLYGLVTVPATAAYAAVRLRLATSGAGVSFVTHVGRAMLVRNADAVPTFFDGNSDSAEWTGDPNASTSVLYPGKQRLVRLASEVDPPIQEAAALLSYQAQFFAEDPRAYSQVLATVSSTDLSAASGGLVDPFTDPILASQSGGGLATFSNAGNRPTPPVFRIYGRCVDPQIVLVGSGRRIVLSGTVPAGSYLELDVQARTVKMDGVTSQLGFLDSENSTWMEAPKGASQWQLISTDFDTSARLDVLGRSAYA